MHRLKAQIRKHLKTPEEEAIFNLGFHPNYKEWTESFGIFNAVKNHLPDLPLNDPSISVVNVGDGRTPRCGPIFAFYTKWKVWSVDPDSRVDNSRIRRQQKRFPQLANFNSVVSTIENFEAPRFDRLIIAACHAHVTIESMLDSLKAKRRALVVMPCCINQEVVNNQMPDKSFEDPYVISPKRRINIWKRI